jgi:hypothetical protein
MSPKKTLFSSTVKFALLSLVFVVFGCIGAKAKPAATPSFVSNSEPTPVLQSRSPFHFNWGKRVADARSAFDSVYFAPVNISRVNQVETEEFGFKISSANESDIAQIADFIHSEFQNALAQRRDPGLQVVSEPRERTLVIELALVELQPTAAYVNIAGTVGGMFLDGVGMSGWLVQKGTVAIELRALSSAGELLGEAADRERDPLTLFNLKNYTEYGHTRRTISEWAAQFAELLCSPVEHVVEDTPAIRWLPW